MTSLEIYKGLTIRRKKFTGIHYSLTYRRKNNQSVSKIQIQGTTNSTIAYFITDFNMTTITTMKSLWMSLLVSILMAFFTSTIITTSQVWSFQIPFGSTPYITKSRMTDPSSQISPFDHHHHHNNNNHRHHCKRPDRVAVYLAGSNDVDNSDNNNNDSDDDGWETDPSTVSTTDMQRQPSPSVPSMQPVSATDRNDDGDLFIPIFTLVSISGLLGAYGYEMIRLYSRGELYLPFLH